MLICQFLEELLVHVYAVGHDHTRIASHRLTHQAHPFPTKADMPLGQVLTDRIAEAAPGKDLAQPGHRLQAAYPVKIGLTSGYRRLTVSNPWNTRFRIHFSRMI